MNEDKFSKSIEDEQLDEVAGGTKVEMSDDIAFLNAIGGNEIKLFPNATPEEVQEAWGLLGIDCTYHEKKPNYYERDYDVGSITRQDAMIEAMRATGKFVDLDQYL